MRIVLLTLAFIGKKVILRDELSLKLAGDLLEESQSEASRLRQRVEELVRDNEALKSSSFAASLCMGGPVQTETQSRFQILKGNEEITFVDMYAYLWIITQCGCHLVDC